MYIRSLALEMKWLIYISPLVNLLWFSSKVGQIHQWIGRFKLVAQLQQSRAPSACFFFFFLISLPLVHVGSEMQWYTMKKCLYTKPSAQSGWAVPSWGGKFSFSMDRTHGHVEAYRRAYLVYALGARLRKAPYPVKCTKQKFFFL